MAAGHWLGTTGVGRHGLMAVSAISVYDRQCWPSARQCLMADRIGVLAALSTSLWE